ncbi:hypothetical protein [Bradyrhizobium cenepequi]|nr:hypothetical protein [Bradyrhizobium cenepequi]MCA6111818.1 hypothetical protein [Bradyrhizobium cenepequi]
MIELIEIKDGGAGLLLSQGPMLQATLKECGQELHPPKQGGDSMLCV